MMTIAQAPGANAIATGDAVLAELERLSASFPPGLEYTIVYDATRFVRASVEQIVTVLVEAFRSEEHTSELQSLMRISYAVFCLNKKKLSNHKSSSQISVT